MAQLRNQSRRLSYMFPCQRRKQAKRSRQSQAWSGPEGSRNLGFPDYMTTAQDGGKDVSLMHRPPLPPGNAPGTHFCCRSQWPRGLRRRSAATRLLRLWVRIPPGAWMFVCCECFVLSGRGLCDELITRPEESYRL